MAFKESLETEMTKLGIDDKDVNKLCQNMVKKIYDELKIP